MTYEQANRSIRLTWVLSMVGILAAILLPYLNEVVDTGHLNSFIPWLFIGPPHFELLLQACLLTFMLYKKSRLGAILLLLVFLNDKVIMLISLHGFDTMYIVTWLLANLAYSLIFIQGIRGTFAYRHLTTANTPEEGSVIKDLKMLWRGKMSLGRAFWAYVGGGLVAALVIPTLFPLPYVSFLTTLLVVLLHVYFVAACIAAWRSAGSFEGKAIWPLLAKVAILFLAFVIIFSLYGMYVLDSGIDAAL